MYVSLLAPVCPLRTLPGAAAFFQSKTQDAVFRRAPAHGKRPKLPGEVRSDADKPVHRFSLARYRALVVHAGPGSRRSGLPDLFDSIAENAAWGKFS